jgi:hypothetical protein
MVALYSSKAGAKSSIHNNVGAPPVLNGLVSRTVRLDERRDQILATGEDRLFLATRPMLVRYAQFRS